MNKTIPGIYNYCDRWCERCPLSHRCLLYLQELDGGLRLEDEDDAEKESFWEELENAARENIEELEEFISDYEDFEAPDEEELEEALKEMEETGEKARHSWLIQLCTVYRETIRVWLEDMDDAYLRQQVSIKIRTNESKETLHKKNYKMASDCLEILNWYLFFMEAKFYRALTGKIGGEEIRFEPNYPTDSEASAKVAMIAVDRSRQALISLWDILPKDKNEETILHSLSVLDQVKREALREFPKAPKAKRPGFDD